MLLFQYYFFVYGWYVFKRRRSQSELEHFIPHEEKSLKYPAACLWWTSSRVAPLLGAARGLEGETMQGAQKLVSVLGNQM